MPLRRIVRSICTNVSPCSKGLGEGGPDRGPHRAPSAPLRTILIIFIIVVTIVIVTAVVIIIIMFIILIIIINITMTTVDDVHLCYVVCEGGRRSEDRFYAPPPARGGGVQKRLSQFWCSRSLKSHFQELVVYIGRGDDTIGNPRRTQIYQFEFFELILLLKLDRKLPVERFEATVSQSTVPSPPLSIESLFPGGGETTRNYKIRRHLKIKET